MTGRLYALLVGVDAYPAPVPSLEGCVNDVAAVSDALTGRVGAGLQAMSLTDAGATRAGVIDAFGSHLAQAGPDDVALFYFSGHGSQQRTAPTTTDEPDGLNETIVLVDSREPGSWDLADKELAVLLGRVAARGAHVLVVLDCCHAGGGTRDLEPGTRLRLAPMDERRRPSRTMLAPTPGPAPADPLATRGDPGNPPPSSWSAAPGDHVLVAACRSSETAKETRVGDRSRGALSAALEDTVRGATGPLTYRDVLRLVTARVERVVDEQHPQIETVRAIDLDRPFLGGAILSTPRRLTVSELPDGWSLDAGAIHGVTPAIGDDSTELALYPLTGETTGRPLATATVVTVLPDRSLVRLSTPLDGAFVYRAVVVGIPLAPLPVAVIGTDSGTAELRRAAADADDTLIALVATDADPALVVEATEGGFSITRPGVTRPLVPVFSGAGHAARTVAALEHVARWMRLASLTNPSSGIAAGAVRVSTTTTAGEVGGDGRLHITYAAGLAPTFSVTLANTTDAPLWCALLDLTETYGVFTDAFPGGSVELGPGQSTTAALSGMVSDSLWEAGTTAVTDQLRVIVSTVEFDPRALEQDELDVAAAGAPVVRDLPEPHTSLDRVLRATTRRIAAEAQAPRPADWSTEDLYVVTTRPRS